MLRERELVRCGVFKAHCTEAVNTTSKQICQGILTHLSVRGKKKNKLIWCDRVTSLSPVILKAGVYNNSRHFELACRLLLYLQSVETTDILFLKVKTAFSQTWASSSCSFCLCVCAVCVAQCVHFLCANWKSDLRRRGQWAWFVTSQTSQNNKNTILVQYSANTKVMCKTEASRHKH